MNGICETRSSSQVFQEEISRQGLEGLICRARVQLAVHPRIKLVDKVFCR